MSKIKKAKGPKMPDRSDNRSLIIGGKAISEDMLTKGQKECLDLFESWYFHNNPSKQILRLGGAAGTGKGVFLRFLIEKYGFGRAECYPMAYTGQAVNVLRGYGIDAYTIHSSIMYPREEPIRDPVTGEVIMHRGVPLVRVRFVSRKDLPRACKLVIVDEASFLPQKLENTLRRYGVKILEVGDPIQLPPVEGDQVFHMDVLDYFMDEIMRQNADSEIIDLATRIRNWEDIDLSKYQKEVRFLYGKERIEDTFSRYLPYFRGAGTILCGTNMQRQIINDLYRDEIIHTHSPLPVEGERMICRRNSWEHMIDQYVLVNGMQGVCTSTVGRTERDKDGITYTMDFMPDVTAKSNKGFSGLLCDYEYLQKPFGIDDELAYKRPGIKMEFAHAITVHVSQGMTTDNILFLDAHGRDTDYTRRLRYTAVTRARNRVTYITAPNIFDPTWTDLRMLSQWAPKTRL